MGFWNELFRGCVHEWSTVEKIVHRSAVEQNNGQFEKAPPWAFIRKEVVILTCKKCGTIKTFDSCFDPLD